MNDVYRGVHHSVVHEIFRKLLELQIVVMTAVRTEMLNDEITYS